jgi:hypothetical protein
MKTLLKAAALLLVLWGDASAQPTNSLWRTYRFQYAFPGEKPYWAWIILPAEYGITNGSFKATVDGIFRSDPTPRISHVCLGAVRDDAGIQKEVTDRLKGTVVLRKYPTRHDANGDMYIDGTPNPLSLEMCRLVKAAILKTSLVKEMDQALLPRGLHISSVGTEKLRVYSEKGAYHWDAIASLEIARAPPGAAGNGSQPIRSVTNRTSSAVGSRR